MYLFKKSRYLFSFGVLLTFIFLVIIILAQRNKPDVDLTEISKDSVFSVFERSGQDSQSLPPPENAYLDGDPEGVLEIEEEKPLPETLVISFTKEGFSPNFTNAVQGQQARWENNTDEDIFIQELIEKHVEFASGITIVAGQSYEQELYNSHLWSFKEINSGKIGRIFIKPN